VIYLSLCSGQVAARADFIGDFSLLFGMGRKPLKWKHEIQPLRGPNPPEHSAAATPGGSVAALGYFFPE
jgi:hypothetical protein